MAAPLSYEEVTKHNKKRRVALGSTQQMCVECGMLTANWVEQFLGDDGKTWINGRLLGEKCTCCGWSFKYDNEAE